MNLPSEPQIKVESKIQKEQQFRFLGSLKPKKGMKLFALDPSTGEVYPVPVVDKKTLNLNQGAGAKMAMIHRNHMHLFALNIENAVRKFKKALAS